MLRTALILAALLLARAVPAAADVMLSLSAPHQTASPGDTVGFIATLINTGADIFYINGDTWVSVLPLDDTAFLSDAPLTLAPGESYTGLFFNVDVPLLTAPGTYSGDFGILGGSTMSAFELAATQAFSVRVPDVQPVPEPSTWICLLTIGPAVVARLRSRGLRKA